MSLRLLVRWGVFWLVCGVAMRAFFLVNYPADSSMLGLQAFLYGGLNDLLAFMLFVGLLAGLGLLNRAWLRYGYCLLIAVSLIVIVAEVFFWLEFEGRLDRLIFHYLAFPKEVLVFLEEQFLMSVFFLPFILVCASVIWLVGWPQNSNASRKESNNWHLDADIAQSRIGLGLAALSAIAIAVFVQPIVPKAYQHSRMASGFTSNGYLEVLVAARYRSDQVSWLRQPKEAIWTLQQHAASASAREVKQQLAHIKHVVIIVEESFAGPVWQDPKLRQTYLPNFVDLEAESVSFSNVFATGSRTTRGLEAILNGFPPLPGIATNQRSGFERLPSLPRQMQDSQFYTAFLYGGWPGFSNFSDYWRGIGFEKIWTRNDFDDQFETSWGVSDESLMRRIVTEMDELTEQHKNVFLSTLTVSHHRPYDFPPDAIDLPSDARSSSHAMAYADHSLGVFFREAKQTDWYKDTLFIVVADHGLHPRGDALIPIGSFRIPLLIHAAGLEPRRIENFASNMNIPATIVESLGLQQTEPFFGQSLWCDCDTTVPVEYGYHVGLIKRDRLEVVSALGQHLVWRYAPGANQLSPISVEAEASADVIEYFSPAYTWYHE